MSMFLKTAEINVGDWFMVDGWTNGDRSYIGSAYSLIGTSEAYSTLLADWETIDGQKCGVKL